MWDECIKMAFNTFLKTVIIIELENFVKIVILYVIFYSFHVYFISFL